VTNPNGGNPPFNFAPWENSVLFTIHEGQMVLLHGFAKKTQKTPPAALDIARERMKDVKK
jgi:phage-related protein